MHGPNKERSWARHGSQGGARARGERQMDVHGHTCVRVSSAAVPEDPRFAVGCTLRSGIRRTPARTTRARARDELLSANARASAGLERRLGLGRRSARARAECGARAKRACSEVDRRRNSARATAPTWSTDHTGRQSRPGALPTARRVPCPPGARDAGASVSVALKKPRASYFPIGERAGARTMRLQWQGCVSPLNFNRACVHGAVLILVTVRVDSNANHASTTSCARPAL